MSVMFEIRIPFTGSSGPMLCIFDTIAVLVDSALQP